MIPHLLWRCPLCATNDALRQRRRFFRPQQLHCTHCAATWDVRRVIGDDYWLKLVASPAHPDRLGTDLPLRRWYAAMKETLSLVPIGDPAVTLEEGERLYLASRRVLLAAEADDPLFFADGREGGTSPEGDGRRLRRGQVGPGRFFLTDRRLIWQGEDGRECSFSLERLNSVYALFNMAILILYETRLYQARFPQESLLKWVTYFAYVAKEVKDTTGHLITTSNF